ncbi:lectin like domain-containing protein [Clostridium sp. Marseille-Q2269]|uniref:lectin like domain-containing protein n=1 Tax=Clostridium sp. Marseille-Q2269 TaxID=2942205 RepID=UPI002072F195|nr:lectin like domain-containing protein [Clostridium sp. Marseille-Q2269]
MKKRVLGFLLVVSIMMLGNNFMVVNAIGYTENLPSNYDLRNVGGKSYVTPARNQGIAGSCWAFAAMSSLESAIMKKNGGVSIKNEEEKHKGVDFIDLSEDHMDRNHGYDYNAKEGGRYECAVSYLDSRKGPYLEKDFPFGKVNNDGTYESTPKKEVTNEKIPYFVQGIKFIENVDVHTFNSENIMLDKIAPIKKAIMNYGAVSTNIYQAHDGRKTFPYTNDKYYNDKTFAYYCDGNDGKYNKTANHAISIVGWDDNFSKENFKTKPKYNGAWICKEEQGTAFGDNGFYYVSYESVCVTTDQYCFKDVVKAEEGFDGIDQNETLGLTGFMGNDFSSSSGNDTYFNVFTAKEDCTLEAAGFYSMGNNSKYKLYVIDNFNNFAKEFDGSKEFSEIGNRYLNTSGSISSAGYSTINLDKPLTLKKGQKYAIGLWMDNSDSFNWMNINNIKNDYVFETKKDVNPGSKNAKINSNETYVYDEEGMFNMDGDTGILVDANTLVKASSSIPELKNIGNLCLKGYYNTDNGSKH